MRKGFRAVAGRIVLVNFKGLYFGLVISLFNTGMFSLPSEGVALSVHGRAAV